MRQPLPDPRWGEAPESCCACGYALQGLKPPGLCPECGVPFEAGCLMLAGIPRRGAGSPLRRAAWIAVVGVAVVYSQAVVPLLFYVGWWAVVVVLVVLVAATIALYATSPRERSGAERFLLTRAGVTRSPLRSRPGDTLLDSRFTPWGDADTVEIVRVSQFWRRLRIGRGEFPGAPPLRSVCFDAGIRCPDDVAPGLHADVRSLLPAASPTPAAGPVGQLG